MCLQSLKIPFGRAIGFVLIYGALIIVVGCGSSDSTSEPAKDGSPGAAKTKGSKSLSLPAEFAGGDRRPVSKETNNPYPIVAIKTNFGEIQVKLDSKKAPRTVENFLENYVARGFYDQTVVHHVDTGFMVAAGGYLEDQTPKETREQILNEANNGLANKRGSVAMCRHPQHAYSATSQFFFNLSDNSELDFQSADSDEEHGYCVFGEVIKGMEVLDRIASVETAEREGFPNWPVKTVMIESAKRLK